MKRFISLISLLLVLVIIGAGCAAADISFSPEAPASDVSGAAVESAMRRETTAPAIMPDSAPAPEMSAEFAPETMERDIAIEDSATPLPLLTPSASRGRRVVYTVDLYLQTTEFMPGIRTLINTVANMDGFVERALVEGRDMRFPWHERSAQYTVRIHSDRLSEFLVIVEDNFNLLLLRQESDDVTVTYEHSESTLDDLRAQEQRLFSTLEDPDLSASDRRSIERTLVDVQSSIRTHERRLSTFDDFVLYSTVNIRLFEVIFPEYLPEEVIEERTFGERFADAVNRSGAAFVAFFQGLLIVIIRILPTLVVLVIIAAIVLLIRRKVKKSWANRKPAANANKHVAGPMRPEEYNGYVPPTYKSDQVHEYRDNSAQVQKDNTDEKSE